MTTLIVTFHNSANCLKMNLKIKPTIIWEGIIVLPSVIPVCELLEDDKECKVQNNTQHTIIMFSFFHTKVLS